MKWSDAETMFPWDREETTPFRSGRRSAKHVLSYQTPASVSVPQVHAPTVELACPFNGVTFSQQLRELADEADTCELDCQEVYGKGELMQTFEAEISQHIGKPAACFVPSGVMAQQIALCAHFDKASDNKNCSGIENASAGEVDVIKCVLLHPSSHLLIHEQDAVRKLLGFEVVSAGAHDSPLTLADVQAALQRRDAQGLPPPTAVIIEVPHRELGGWNTPEPDLRKISALCRGRGIALHMDGARLWDTAPFFAATGGVQGVAALFDSVYVSFYKGLGGPVGAMLLGEERFVCAARVWLRRFGGNLYTMAPFVLANRRAFHALKGSFEARTERLVQVVSAISTALAGVVGHKQQPRVRFVPAVPECAQVHVYLVGGCAELNAARDATIASHGISVFDRTRGPGVSDGSEQCFEFKMGPCNMTIPDDIFVKGWLAFVQHLQER